MKRRRIILGAAALALAIAAGIVWWWWAHRPANIELVDIPPGEFMMGSPETEEGRYGWENQHLVRITYAFKMSKTEVSQKQWRKVMGTSVRQQWGKEQSQLGQRIREAIDDILVEPKRAWEKIMWIVIGDEPEPWELSGEGDEYPMYYVSRDDAMEFCARLTELGHLSGRLPAEQEFRLPTEAEWEYACRAGSSTRFANGNTEADLKTMGWYGDNASGTAHPVGTKRPNAWGLHDMHGNIQEWCLDWYGPYPQGNVADPITSRSDASLLVSNRWIGYCRLARGGNWLQPLGYCRSAARQEIPPGDSDNRSKILGFRVVLGPPVRSGKAEPGK